ncbi:MAG: glycosyltransferase, partial [Rhodothermales bacterium]
MVATFYALGMAVLLLYGLNLLVLALAHARSERLLPGEPPEPDVRPALPTPLPTLTVQLPLYNEAYVAERLIDACAGLDWPRRLLEIQVLDDST